MLGKYEIQERLGRGGMAEVYLAYHSNLDRYVAIKILHAFLAEDNEFRVRFEKEARNIAKLSHAHIVRVYDFDYAEDRDSYYMVMELIKGESLKERLQDISDANERLPVKEVLRIIREAASALAYAHSRGMIHRDVKPANLMIDEDNRIVLTDFGIAKMLDSKQLTVSGGMIGTPAYMSPEQGLGEAGNERSDIYSLGVIMYQLLVGQLPYDAETALGVILMHVNDPIPMVRSYNRNIPETVQEVVNRAMAKDPNDRYQTADEMIADIEHCEMEMSSGEVTRTRPPELLTKPEPSPQPKPQTPSSPANAKPAPNTTEDRLRTNQAMSKLEPQNNNNLRWIIPMVALILLVGGGFFGAIQLGLVGGNIPPTTDVAVLAANETSTALALAEAITEESTVTPAATVTNTATSSPSPTETPTNTPTLTTTAIPTETSTQPPPSETPTPSQTPNMTATIAAEQTATIAACTFDYAIVDQVPDNGEDGGFFPVNQPYTRQIALLNTGTCHWGENTSLTFVGGEDFDAGPRIFIRESLQIGEEVTVVFEGTTPQSGSVEPYTGTWQLRTRGQRDIGVPLVISVLVFDPGS
jgi:eukaryotic-like serine/threonine-protein kinase